MYCRLFGTYTDDKGCTQCDINAGYEPGTWKYHCARDEHHPTLSGLRWWLRTTALKFKLYIIIRWITKRLPLKKSWTIWSDRHGLHIGVWRPTWSWVEPHTLEEKANE